VDHHYTGNDMPMYPSRYPGWL